MAGVDEDGKTRKWQWLLTGNGTRGPMGIISLWKICRGGYSSGGRGMGQDNDIFVSSMGLSWAGHGLEIQL